MEYGFITKTDSGSILASSDYFNYHLVPGVSFVTSYLGTVGGRVYTYTVYYPYSQPPVVFIQLAINDTAAVSGFTQNGDYWSFNVVGTAASDVTKINCFGKTFNASNIGQGIAIRNASNEVTFSSTNNPLWVTDYFIYQNTNTLTGTLAYNNSNPIFTCSLVWYGYNPRTGSGGYIGWKRTGSNTFSSTWIGPGGVSLSLKYAGIIVGELIV